MDAGGCGSRIFWARKAHPFWEFNGLPSALTQHDSEVKAGHCCYEGTFFLMSVTKKTFVVAIAML